MQASIEPALATWSWLWARCLPLFVLVPWLLFRRFSWLAIALSAGFAAVLVPLVASGPAAPNDLLRELVVGCALAIGAAAPFLVLSVAAAIIDGLREQESFLAPSRLAQAASLAGLAAAASSGYLSGSARLLLETPPAAARAANRVPGLLRELAQLLLQAFELGVSFSAPVLFGVFCCAIVLGLLGRAALRIVTPVSGSALLPYFGLAIVCLATANWFEAVPELVRMFARQTTRILGTWH